MTNGILGFAHLLVHQDAQNSRGDQARRLGIQQPVLTPLGARVPHSLG